MEDAARQKPAFSRFAPTEAGADAVPLRTLGAAMKSVIFPDLNTTRLTEPCWSTKSVSAPMSGISRAEKWTGTLWKTGFRAEADVHRDSRTGPIKSASLTRTD